MNATRDRIFRNCIPDTMIMALDVHAGESRKAAIRRRRWAFLDEHAYDALLAKISQPSPHSHSNVVLRCPLLNRLQDFYGGYSYHFSELKPLIDEIEQIKQEFADDELVLTTLETLKKACRDARNGSLNLYFFGD